MPVAKSNEKANQLRAEGNKFYSQRKFFEALLKYNESLCFAETGSETVGLAYANRSAVYFEMKLFAKCLNNVQMAKVHGYPEKNFEILNKRDEKCKETMKSEKQKFPDSRSVFKLSYPANKKLPFIVDCLELKESKKFGRFVITNSSLKVGDIISMERPFCSVLLSESKFHDIPEANIYQRCSNCLIENALDLIPCTTCCKAMFCSADCYSMATKRYHGYECPIIDQLLKSGSVHMSIRVFFIALSAFDGSIDNLKDFMKRNENRNATVFDFDMSSREGNDKNLLLALLSLVKSPKMFALQHHEDILKNHPQFINDWQNNHEFILKFLLRICQTSDWNFHGIFSGNSQAKTDQNAVKLLSNLQQSIGSGSLLFSSLINHSCASNVLRVCVDGKIVFVVCRPIAKGSQIFDCYKINFMTQQKPDRQAKLFQEFGFTCDCEACSGNFPTPPSLTYKDIKMLKFAKKTEDELLELPAGQVMRKFRSCCDIVEKNNQSFPSIEHCLLQKCIATCLLRQAQPEVLFP